ncbi:D-arginine dehydrogenase [Sphingomonas vulcanisoli]|uniref:D-arginine dehydrogenase n=1 Tax=Sphingomonas vulcanisoli TaxID=1658060 RepID=A0ABX0TS72_9SPHN|nr:FAD-dependent oxidoreductase [Sphingomonas vulcanisoli]NIJ06994.1 D-arginine dehydrogenase [Sphingomonas vulcanisoli]
MHSTDIAIIGAGIAGASLAAAIGRRARVLLIEAEAQPGYHATGRSAAFWSESYGGPAVQPLTTASAAALAPYLSPRGCLHIADPEGDGALAALAAEFAGGAPLLEPVGPAALHALLPGLAPQFGRALFEPSCQDIDVAAYHTAILTEARHAGVGLLLNAPVREAARTGSGWRLTTRAGDVAAGLVVNAAGAWATTIARMAGAMAIAVTPHRRTVIQLLTDPPAAADLPLVMDAAGRFYFKPEAGGRIWLTPHDETACPAHDVAPEEIDIAVAIDRFQQAMTWQVVKRERAWAGLRSFAPDRAPIYGFDPQAPGFFWFAGQGGFGIQTAPAAAAIGAALLLEQPMPDWVAHIDLEPYAPGRFR